MTLDLIKSKKTVETNKDNVIIEKILETAKGGRTLNVEGFPDDFISAGHVIILENGEYKPQPVDGTKAALAVGVLIGSISKEKPHAAILMRGTVNEGALKYEITSATKDALGDRIAYALNP